MKAVRTISWCGKPLLLVCITFALSLSGIAQCTGSSQTITYDTVAIGSGNDSHVFNLPQFNPALGTLTGIEVNSVVSVNYGFTLKNINSYPIDFSIAVGRKDNFQSTAINVDYSNSLMANVGTFAVNPDQTITQAPTPVINRYDNAVNVTDHILDFIGSGNVQFTYSPRTYTSHSGSQTYEYSATADDTIHFSVTYAFCSSIILADDIVDFAAYRQGLSAVKLTWNSSGELQGRVYEVEKSVDGRQFSTAGLLDAAGHPGSNYIFDYQAMPTEKSKLWFRLKISDTSGVTKYSEIRWVDLSASPDSRMYLYPNPSDRFVNIVFSHAGNWDVEILAANGALIQTNESLNASGARINFNHSLSKGPYFARVIDKQNFRQYVLGFVVQ